jgi:hypothetical protein
MKVEGSMINSKLQFIMDSKRTSPGPMSAEPTVGHELKQAQVMRTVNSAIAVIAGYVKGKPVSA